MRKMSLVSFMLITLCIISNAKGVDWFSRKNTNSADAKGPSDPTGNKVSDPTENKIGDSSETKIDDSDGTKSGDSIDTKSGDPTGTKSSNPTIGTESDNSGTRTAGSDSPGTSKDKASQDSNPNDLQTSTDEKIRELAASAEQRDAINLMNLISREVVEVDEEVVHECAHGKDDHDHDHDHSKGTNDQPCTKDNKPSTSDTKEDDHDHDHSKFPNDQPCTKDNKPSTSDTKEDDHDHDHDHSKFPNDQPCTKDNKPSTSDTKESKATSDTEEDEKVKDETVVTSPKARMIRNNHGIVFKYEVDFAYPLFNMKGFRGGLAAGYITPESNVEDFEHITVSTNGTIKLFLFGEFGLVKKDNSTFGVTGEAFLEIKRGNGEIEIGAGIKFSMAGKTLFEREESVGNHMKESPPFCFTIPQLAGIQFCQVAFDFTFRTNFTGSACIQTEIKHGFCPIPLVTIQYHCINFSGKKFYTSESTRKSGVINPKEVYTTFTRRIPSAKGKSCPNKQAQQSSPSMKTSVKDRKDPSTRNSDKNSKITSTSKQ